MASTPDFDAYRSEFPIVREQLSFNHAGVAPTSQRAVAAIPEWSEDLLQHGVRNERPWEAQAEAAKPEFKAMDSDARFAAVLRALSRPAPKATTWVGGKAARIDRKEDKTVLTIDDGAAPDFGSFLVERMDALYREYLDRRNEAA